MLRLSRSKLFDAARMSHVAHLSTATPAAAALPPTAFPLLRSVAEVRAWREEQRAASLDVGFVPTMGALHDGHLSLVRASLAQNPRTILSIFVNPAQFAPHEDLATYPRPLAADLALLNSLPGPGVSAVFLPPVEEIYQGGISTNVAEQRGTFVEVKGLQDGMEGGSRPGFFRGVATVVTKLFNIVQPTRAYFGQKDIQQAILLRRLLSDLHMTSPSPSSLVILPTHRSPTAGSLALSSRNAYLTPSERVFAPTLYSALLAASSIWSSQRAQGDGTVSVSDVLEAARDVVRRVEREAEKEGIVVKGMYFSLNDPEELWDLEGRGDGKVRVGKGAVLSGAVMVGRTRLIDNVVFEYDLNE